MRLKQLRGMPVIDPTAARKVGTVSDVQVDATAGRLAGLVVGAPEGEDQRTIPAERIRRVGSSAVMLTARGASSQNGATESTEHCLDTATLVGLEVIGDDGSAIGRLLDATFDQDSLRIQAYLLRSNLFQRLTRRPAIIEPGNVQACSRELMIVATGHVAQEPAPRDELPTAPIPLQLKEEDRVAAPALDSAPESEPVGARSA